MRKRQGIVVGSLWQRFSALMVDGVAIMLWTILVYRIGGNLMIDPLFLLLLLQVGCLSYEILFVALRGRTPGKALAGIRVIDPMQRKAQGIGLSKAILRYLPTITAGIFGFFIQVYAITKMPAELRGPLPLDRMHSFMEFFVPGTGFYSKIELGIVFGWSILELVSAAMNSHRRAIHDVIANTLVVRERQLKDDGRRGHFIGASRAWLGIAAYMVCSVGFGLFMHSPIENYDRNGRLRALASFSPGDGEKVILYWPNGSMRHQFVNRMGVISERVWTSWDETGKKIDEKILPSSY